MIACRLTFGLVCLTAIVVGICILALQIVTASARAWVFVSVAQAQSSLSFGIFSQQAMTLTMVRNVPLVCLQAMLVFSIGFGSIAVIATMISVTQRQICDRGTHFYVLMADICFVLSAITNLVGISVFTHFWIQDASAFFHPTAKEATYGYGYAYMLGWFIFFLQTALAVFTIVGIHVVVRKHDKELIEGDDSTNERKKLVETQAARTPDNELGEGSSKMRSRNAESTSPFEKVEESKDLGVATDAEVPAEQVLVAEVPTTEGSTTEVPPTDVPPTEVPTTMN